jgi:hypothetical protein
MTNEGNTVAVSDAKSRLLPWEPGVFVFYPKYRATYYSPWMLLVTKTTLETIRKAMNK